MGPKYWLVVIVMELLSDEDSDPLGDGGNELAPDDDDDPARVECGEKGSLLMLNDPGEDGSPAEKFKMS
jgi:hypothetical protein